MEARQSTSQQTHVNLQWSGNALVKNLHVNLHTIQASRIFKEDSKQGFFQEGACFNQNSTCFDLETRLSTMNIQIAICTRTPKWTLVAPGTILVNPFQTSSRRGSHAFPREALELRNQAPVKFRSLGSSETKPHLIRFWSLNSHETKPSQHVGGVL